MNLNEILSRDKTFRYQLLDRLRSDCEYYLGYGNRYFGHLWGSTEIEHIEYMKALWNSFKEDEKPEWLSFSKILEYEKAMTGNIQYIDDMKQLAKDIDKFSKDYDPYEYGDTVSGREEEHFDKLCEDISNGNVEHLVKWLKDIIEEDEIPENVQEAKALLKRLEESHETTGKSTSLDEKITNAKSKPETDAKKVERKLTEGFEI